MRNVVLAYLRKRPNAEVLCLALIALVGFCLLFFKPYRIHEWLDAHEVMLFWLEIGLLSVIIVVLLVHISELRTQLQEQMLLHGDVDTSDVIPMFNFYDERGELKLSVKPESVYYLEAADNYVQIYYQTTGKMQVLMIRNSLKNIEWRFHDTTLMRCHRSYLVNLSNVQMMKRIDGDVYLDFNDEKIEHIPVSKAYANRVMTYFAKINSK